MTVVHRLVGYDRETDRMRERFDIPRASLRQAIAIAEVGDDDPDAACSYALSPDQAQKIADLLGIAIERSQLEFFLEAFASSA
jgi:hypothetical protein